ncbi:MAG: hypothetical protein WD875_02270 [Pirellulales bacterium]
MNFTRPIAIVLVVATMFSAAVFFAPSAASADGPAWWDPLNLTGSAKPARPPARKAAAKDSSWLKLPGFGTDSAKKPAARKSSEPSTLTKMNNSTKRFFSGAKDALTFGDDKKTSSRPTGYGTGGSEKRVARSATAEKESKGNILTSWWKTAEPQPKRPKTVPDFISGDRP